jgi:hypothetical protein
VLSCRGNTVLFEAVKQLIITQFPQFDADKMSRDLPQWRDIDPKNPKRILLQN